ncbi:hypothetical protein ILYODFUR_036818 [Ilyodon furcidens]|uniref:Uncharacterized protein n=1 Tax=Ilyodon furcidens TaxID=33524 RepID=A0ABV0TU37_9TELE
MSGCLEEEELGAESPGSSSSSMKSNWSKEKPPDFSAGPGPSDTEFLSDETRSAAASLTTRTLNRSISSSCRDGGFSFSPD